MRAGGVLRLYLNGRLATTSASFNPEQYDLTVQQPMKIGFGEHDYFTGRIREVRLYHRALTEQEVAALQAAQSP